MSNYDNSRIDITQPNEVQWRMLIDKYGDVSKIPAIERPLDMAAAFDSEEIKQTEDSFAIPGAFRKSINETLAKDGLALEEPQTKSPGTSNTGQKFDAGKPRLDLIPPEALLAIGEVLSYGVQKYDKVNRAYNWRHGMAWSRPLASIFRHLCAWMMGERFDKESGLSHLAHIGTNVMFLITYETTGTGTDDRWKP